MEGPHSAGDLPALQGWASVAQLPTALSPAMETARVGLIPPVHPTDHPQFTQRSPHNPGTFAQGLAPTDYTVQAKLGGISEGETENQQLQYRTWN